MLWQYSDGDPLKGRRIQGYKNYDFRPISCFGMTVGVSNIVNKCGPSSMLTRASIDFIYISRRICRRKQNRIYLYALVSETGITNNKTALEVLYCSVEVNYRHNRAAALRQLSFLMVYLTIEYLYSPVTRQLVDKSKQ